MHSMDVDQEDRFGGVRSHLRDRQHMPGDWGLGPGDTNGDANDSHTCPPNTTHTLINPHTSVICHLLWLT